MAAGTGNKFYIEPAKANITPILQGIGSLIKSSRDEKKLAEQSNALMQAYKSNDPEQVALMISKNPELGKSLTAMLGHKNYALEKGYTDTVRQVFNEPDPVKRGNILAKRVYDVDQAGGDSTESQMALGQLNEDPVSFQKALELEFARTSPVAWNAYQSGGGTDNKGFFTEERKIASQDVRAFNKQANEMRSSYGKLKGLANQAKSGDRGARNAMVVSLARLISPGIVTETEAAALGGGQNTMQAVISGLTGKGVDTDAILRQIDPYGDSFDSDALLKVGESVVASSRQPLIDMYEGSRSRAERAGIGDKAFRTNFGANANYDFLTRFLASNNIGAGNPISKGSLTIDEDKELARLEEKYGDR